MCFASWSKWRHPDRYPTNIEYVRYRKYRVLHTIAELEAMGLDFRDMIRRGSMAGPFTN